MLSFYVIHITKSGNALWVEDTMYLLLSVRKCLQKNEFKQQLVKVTTTLERDKDRISAKILDI